MVRPSFVKMLTSGDNKLSFKEFLLEVFWYNSFTTLLRRVGRFIKRLIRWVPALWKQEEWDYAYIYDLLIMKMQELRKSLSEDTWHEPKCVQRSIKEIDVCLARLDRYLNWTEYYDFPMDDIYYEDLENGCKKMCYASEKNEKQRLGATDFEEKNFKKFWQDFIEWHRGWWT